MKLTELRKRLIEEKEKKLRGVFWTRSNKKENKKAKKMSKASRKINRK